MLKALIKKQFMELNAAYFQNSKTGKRRSRSGTIGMIVLCIFLFLCLAAMFFGMGMMMGTTLLMPGLGLEWLYFAMIGMIAMLLGVFGSVFNTYKGLFHAKDNEMLLAMPIPPFMILTARIAGVYLMSLLYCGLVWIPSCICAWVICPPTVAQVILQILLFFVISLFVTGITCILGWPIALISSKLKNRSFVTVLIGLIVFGAYYYVCFNLNQLLGQFVQNVESIGVKIKTFVYPIYSLGRGAAGEAVPFLMFTLISVVLFLVVTAILAKSFISITTMNKGEKKAVYVQKEVKVQDAGKALFRKELKRFTSSSTYMMNAGLGIVFSPVICVLLLVKMSDIRGFLPAITGEIPSFAPMVPMVVLVAVLMLGAMNTISVPSISLEGKSIWIAQTLPVSAWEVLKAKESLHVIMNLIPAFLLSVVGGFVLQIEISQMILILAAVWMYVWFSADFGLFLNLKHYNLTWTSEAIPIKQSSGVAIYLFGGWVIAAVILIGSYFAAKLVPVETILTVVLVIFVLLYRVLHNWIKTKGAEIFSTIS